MAALVPRAEIEGDMGDPTMGVHARLMSQALRKLSGAINQTKTTVVFTNQCPTCGMTTAWAYLMRERGLRRAERMRAGRRWECWRWRPPPACLAPRFAARWLAAVPSERAAVWVSAIVLLVTMTDWAIRVLVPLVVHL